MDLFIAPSRYFGDLMRERLGLPADRVRVVYNGINLDGYGDEGRGVKSEGRRPDRTQSSPLASRPSPFVLGFFARMCREKGLDTLVEAYILLRQRGRVGKLKLRVGGSCGPADEAFVDSLRERLRSQRPARRGGVSSQP